MFKKMSWSLLSALALASIVYVASTALMPGILALLSHGFELKLPGAGVLYLLGAAIAVFLGVFQFNVTFRRKYFALHKTLGTVYIGSVIVAGVFGLMFAYQMSGHAAMQAGIAVAAISGFITTARGYQLVCQRNVRSHGKWMAWSYALASLNMMIGLGLSWFF